MSAQAVEISKWEQFKLILKDLNELTKYKEKTFMDLLKPLHALSEMIIPDNNSSDKELMSQIKVKMLPFEMDNCSTVTLQILSELVRRGVDEMGEKDIGKTLENMLIMRNICYSLWLMACTYRESRKKNKDKLKVDLGKIDIMLWEIKREFEGLMLRLLARYPEEEFFEYAKENLLQKSFERLYNVLRFIAMPEKITLAYFYSESVTRPLWERLDDRKDYAEVIERGGGMCKVCLTEFTDLSDCAILDSCDHLYCLECVEENFKTKSGRFCSACNKIVKQWINRHEFGKYKKTKIEMPAEHVIRSLF